MGLLGCSSGGAGVGPDAATVDRGVLDSGAADEGVPDEGVPDAGLVEEAPAARLYRYLLGRFDSADQAQADNRYFAIQLLSCPVLAPALGEKVMYIEQARLESPQQPYRQRLYVVTPGETEGSAVSRVYELVAPQAAVNLCAGPERTFAASDVVAREGCDVVLSYQEGRFVGGTVGKDCASTLQGASYATSEVILEESLLESWDRGYDANDRQVWGAVAGPYRFVRRTPLPD